MRWTPAALLLLLACGGQETTVVAPGPDFYELAPGEADLATQIEDVGRLCDSGSGCAPGVACTNMVYTAHPECELPWPADALCPHGTTHLLVGTVVGDNVAIKGSFCLVGCRSDSDCRLEGQSCVGPSGSVSHYCLR